MKEARENGVQDTEGKSEEASTDTEQAGSDDGAILLEITKMYHSKRRPDVLVSGDKLMEGYGRGQRFDALQSEHHELQAQDEAKTEKLEEAEALIAQLEADARMVQAMKNLGINQQATAGNQQKEQDQEWLGDEPKTGDQDQVANRLNDFEAELKSHYDPEKTAQSVKDEVARLYSMEREQRDAEDRNVAAAKQIRQTKFANLRVTYPDINEDALNEIVGAHSQYLGHMINAVDLARAGKNQESLDAVYDGEEQLEAMLAKQLGIKEQQTKLTAERERRAELESLSGGSPAGEEDEEEHEPLQDWHDGDKRRKSLLEKAKKAMARRKVLKTV